MKRWPLYYFAIIVFISTKVAAQVGIGTTTPVTELEIYSPDESTTLTNFTQALGNGGLLIQTDYTANAYTPGLFWSTSNDNNTKPKAGIFLQETASGTYMVFGTSNAYATGITNTSFQISPIGNASYGDGSFYGDSRLSIAGTRGNNDATFTTAMEDGTTNPAFSILPWTGQVYLTSGVYYNNGSWVHHSDDGNNQLFVLDPGGGVRWYASNTGSGSWNVASNEQLWDDAGNWKNLVQSTHGGNSYFTGGNVGVGTSSPSETFHVAGTLRFSGNGESAGDVMISDATGVATWQPASTVQDGNGIYDGDGTTPAGVDVTVTDNIDFDGGTLFIDGTNNRVGIGSASPSTALTFGGTDPTISTNTSDASDTKRLLLASGGTASLLRGAYFYLSGNEHATTAGRAVIVAGNPAAPTGTEGSIGLFTGAGLERMTVQRDGNVGINETAPSEFLHISSTGSTRIRLEADTDNGPGEGDQPQILFEQDGGAVTGLVGYANSANRFLISSAYTGADGGIGFQAGASTRMTILTSGNVGIGTTTPTEKLDVFPGTDNSSQIGQAHVGYMGFADYAGFSHVDRNATGSYALLQHTGGTTYLNSASGTPIYFRVNNVSQMMMNTTGLGIGNTSPSAKLHVTGSVRFASNGEAANRILVSDATGVATWQDASATNTNSWQLDGNSGTAPATNFVGTTDGQDLVFRTNNVEEMRITSAGNVGIGTSTPANEVEVNGWIGRSAHNNGALVGSYNNIAANGAFSNPIYVIGSNYKPSTTTLSNMYGVGYALTNSASFLTSQTVNTWGFYVAGVGVARAFIGANPNGNTYFNTGGNVGINETTPELPLHVNKSGATSDAVWNSGYFVATKTTDMGDGFGTGFRFRIEDNAAVQNSIASISAIRSGADNSGLLQLGTYSAGTLNQHVYILPSGNVGIGTSTPANEVEVNGWVGRTAHEVGGLVGSYNNVGVNATNSNPIYVIGSNYKPTSTTLSNMYGTGYTHTNASFVTAGTGAGWGQYVASDGDARIWLGADAAGNSYFNTTGRFGLGTDSPESKLHVFEPGEGTQNNKKTNVATAGITVETEYTDGSFTPGLFWKTSNNNPTRPKAGIYLLESSSGTSMYFGTSNAYATGITNDAMIINPTGQVGVLRTPEVALDANIAGSVFRLRGLAPTTDYIDFSIQGTGALLVNLTTSSGNGSVEYRTKNTTHGFLLRESDGTGTTAYSNFFVTDAATDYLSINVNNATTISALNVDSDNQVGIGIVPAVKLDIDQGDDNQGIRLRGSTETTEISDIHAGSGGRLIFDNTNSTSTSALFDFRGKSSQHGIIIRESDGTGTAAYANLFVTENGGNDYLSISMSNVTSTSALNVTEQHFVGIGTAAPASKLDIYTSSNSLGLVVRGSDPTNEVVNMYLGGQGQFVIDNTSGTDTQKFIDLRGEDANSGVIIRQSSNVGSAYGNLYVVDNATSDYISINVSAPTTTSALNVTASNRVGIGTSNPGGQFELSLNEGRKPGSGSWTIVSDERLKTITGSFNKGLAELDRLQPVTYKYKNVGERKFDSKILETEFVGFTAQNVKEVFPEAVGEDEDGYLNLDSQAILVAYLNAIKELKRENDAQKKDIEQLKKLVDELRSR